MIRAIFVRNGVLRQLGGVPDALMEEHRLCGRAAPPGTAGVGAGDRLDLRPTVPCPGTVAHVLPADGPRHPALLDGSPTRNLCAGFMKAALVRRAVPEMIRDGLTEGVENGRENLVAHAIHLHEGGPGSRGVQDACTALGGATSSSLPATSRTVSRMPAHPVHRIQS